MATARIDNGIGAAHRPGPGRPADPELAERRRRQIVEAAYRVFGANGYHDTGITEIMQEAALGRGTFYLYFENKREILDGVIDYTIEQILAAIGADMQSAELTTLDDFERLLRGVAENLFQLLDENPTLSTVLIRNGLVDEAITARMLGLADTFTAVITMYVDRGMDAGILDPALDASAVAHALTGFAIGGLLRGISGDFPTDARAAYVDTAIAVVARFGPAGATGSD